MQNHAQKIELHLPNSLVNVLSVKDPNMMHRSLFQYGDLPLKANLRLNEQYQIKGAQRNFRGITISLTRAYTFKKYSSWLKLLIINQLLKIKKVPA